MRATPHQNRVYSRTGSSETDPTLCGIRQNLIGQLSAAASRIFQTTTRLNELAGTRNTVEFAKARTEARLARKSFEELKASLARHRIERAS